MTFRLVIYSSLKELEVYNEDNQEIVFISAETVAWSTPGGLRAVPRPKLVDPTPYVSAEDAFFLGEGWQRIQKDLLTLSMRGLLEEFPPEGWSALFPTLRR